MTGIRSDGQARIDSLMQRNGRPSDIVAHIVEAQNRDIGNLRARRTAGVEGQSESGQGKLFSH
jgi:hypothetical protein